MNAIKICLFVLLLSTIGCAKKSHEFPMEKQYWTPEDYENIVRELKYNYKDDEKLPTLDDPETKAFFQKFSDPANYNVVLDDTTLGLKYKSEFATAFFMRWKDMADVYTALDRLDRYLYEEEMLLVYHFGLGIQIKYFKLGNDEILENQVDVNAPEVQDVIRKNANTLIGNMTHYLDEVNNEKAFTDKGKSLLAKGINEHFTNLVDTFPDADFSPISDKAKLLVSKTNSEEIKTVLKDLLEKIAKTKSSQPEPAV